MKFCVYGEDDQEGGRTPQGVRGLKYPVSVDVVVVIWSHPARGAWIEIS